MKPVMKPDDDILKTAKYNTGILKEGRDANEN